MCGAFWARCVDCGSDGMVEEKGTEDRISSSSLKASDCRLFDAARWQLLKAGPRVIGKHRLELF
jgi:hypothetical protein